MTSARRGPPDPAGVVVPVMTAMRFADYVKTAFFNRWNLLAFLSGVAFGLICGRPDAVLPLVAAAELGYLGLLASHPKFQRYVDAQHAKTARQAASQAGQAALARIMRSLPRKSVDRFEALRSQCLELQHLAGQLRQPATAAGHPLEEFQLAGLDRLLWLYLRLLYTQHALGRFLQKTDERVMLQDIESLQKRIADLPAEPVGVQAQRIRQTLEDNLQTSRARLANLAKARDNFQLVEVQIEQLENKIRALSEMAVNRQEPEFVTSEVEQVAASMLATERTMNELQFATGLAALDTETPELLRARLTERGK